MSDAEYQGYSIVAFIDLLGTSAANKAIDAQDDMAVAAKMLAKEVGKVQRFRDDFMDVFEACRQTEKKLEALRPEALKPSLETLQGNPFNNYAFSDSLILHASLNTTQGSQAPVDSCFQILVALASAQLSSLYRGAPFRGGVEIGRAAVFGDREILGPALSEAVRLEKEDALFPRVVVGKEMVRYLELNCQLEESSADNRASRQYALICQSLMCADGDGAFTVDVWSPLFIEMVGGAQSHKVLIDRAMQYAQSQIARFKTERCDYLAEKYRYLVQYLSGGREGA